MEHGNVATSAVLGISSVAYALISRKGVEAILFWIPVFMGIFEYDVPLKIAIRNTGDLAMIAFIVAFAAASMLFLPYLIIPYALFFAVYATRLPMARNKLNHYGNAIGLLAYSLLFSFTIQGVNFLSFVIGGTLFLYLVGAEFSVRSKLKRNGKLLLYNVFPAFLGLLEPGFFIYSLSLIRIPAATVTREVRKIGMIETSLMIIVVAFLLLSLHSGAIFTPNIHSTFLKY
ncbi:MAG: hypothetical protein QXN66_05080 [Thermoplasmatales archaeon]